MSLNRSPAFIMPDIVARNYTTVSSAATAGGYVPTTLPLSNVQTEEPSELSRINTLDPLYTRWHFSMGGIQSAFGGFGIVNSNFSPGAVYRLIGWDGKDGTLVTRQLIPNSIAASTNITGAVTAVDELISTPDSSYIVPTDPALSWSVRFGFPTPPSAPALGFGKAVIVLRVNRVNTPANTQGTPRIRVQLYENGSLVDDSTETDRAVTVAAPGQVLIFPIDFSVLADQTGTNIEVSILCTPGDNSSYARLEAVRIYYEYATVLGLEYDSGYIAAPFNSYSDQDSDPPNKTVGHWPEQLVAPSLKSFELLVMDDQVDHLNENDLTGTADNGVLINALPQLDGPLGYIDIGVVPAGPTLFLGNAPYPETPSGSPNVVEISGLTITGKSYSADAFRQRTLTVRLRLTRDQLLTLQDRIGWRRGHSGAFFFAAEPDIAPERQLFNAGWWTLESMDEPVREQDAYDDGDGTMLFITSLRLLEKL